MYIYIGKNSAGQHIFEDTTDYNELPEIVRKLFDENNITE
jgi:hypothetical protein